MKKIVLALAAVAAFLVPVSADAIGHVHSNSSHHAIDWD